MRSRRGIVIALLLGLVLFVSACAQKATTVSAADFYAKNSVTLVVGYTPGGGTDLGARLFASFWKEATGGDMVVENRTGASGLEAANYVFNAKPDGLTLGIDVMANDLLWWLFQTPGMYFKMEEYQPIGLFLDESKVFAIANGSPHSGKSLQEVLKIDGLKIGGASPQGNLSVGAALLAEILSLKNAKVIVGYTGSAQLGVAGGRGEIDAVCDIATSVKDYVPKYFNAPLVNLDRKKSVHWPTTPAITEVAKLSPQQDELLTIFIECRTGKVILVGPGVPEDRVKFMRAAFDKIMKMDSFVQQLEKRWPIWVPATPGDVVSKEIKQVMSLPPDKLSEFRRVLGKYLK